jgi:hypothetical protein
VDAAVGPDAPTACKPYGSTCDDNAISFCNYDGSAIAAVVPCDPGDTCTAKGSNANCSRQICQVGKTCKDDKVVQEITCFTADKFTPTYDKVIVVEDCPSQGLICGGPIQCVPKVCEPDSKSCKSKTVAQTCSFRGDRWFENPCASPKECNAGVCGIPICTANQPTCNDNIATVCGADATSYLDGGTPCADTGKVCSQGACVECWPTVYYCAGSTVRHCALDGKSSTLSATCASTQACDPATGTCRDKVCTPGKPACNGDVATTCNEDGSGYMAGGTACADTGKHCSQGACATLACIPNAVFCSGKTLQRCAPDGQSASVVQTCAGSEACDNATVACKTLFCTPRQTSCQDNSVMTCNDDGSDYVDSGHYCDPESEGLCRSGKCTGGPVSCQIGKSSCEGNLRLSCWSNGRAHPGETCSDLEYCDNQTGSCLPRQCIPNQPACNGNNKIVCSPDGLGTAGEGTSCGSQHCVDGTCRDALFVDDFEDANLVGWLPRASQLARTCKITSTWAAAGTRYALVQSHPKIDSSMKRSFADLQPKRISWWAMAESRTVVSGTLVLRSPIGQIAKVHFHSNGMLVLENGLAASPPVSIPYVAKRWYPMELRNLDTTAKTFDFYVNDTLIVAGMKFGDSYSPLASSISGLELSTPAGSTVTWDEITFD